MALATTHETRDIRWMQRAIAYAARSLGRTAPNPNVGCMVVASDALVGRGRTGQGGRPHAEPQALAQAGDAARGATAYVTLEPCCHHGVTPPCAEALVRAGIARVVVAVEDPDPRVAGKGIAYLRSQGIAVDVGVLTEAATAVQEGFLRRITTQRPVVILKIATSLDGKIALANGESQWITDSLARRYGHGLRARCDAILVGGNTLSADDPRLDCRLRGLEASTPARVIVGSPERFRPTLRCLQPSNRAATFWCSSQPFPPDEATMYGIVPITLPAHDSTAAMHTMLNSLCAHGITRVLVEGGGHIVASLFHAGCVDYVVWCRGESVLGSDARDGVGPLAIPHLDARIQLATLYTDGPATWYRVLKPSRASS